MILKKHFYQIFLIIIFCVINGIQPLYAQVNGKVIDAETGDPIPSVNIHYIKNRQYGVTTDIDGRYEISSDITGVDTLVFSFVGFRSERVLIKPGSKRRVNINLEPIDKTLDEVVITSKKSRYRRKNNPAVELMRKVIDAKKNSDLPDVAFFKFAVPSRPFFSHR